MTFPIEDLEALILGRRSVRTGYDQRAIPRPVLERIIRCGLAAPCSKGAAPWRFTVVTDRARLARLADAVASAPGGDAYVPHDPRTGQPRPGLESSVSESAEVLGEAAAAVFIENAGPFSGGRRALCDADAPARHLAVIGYELELAGLGAALENMWLAALAEGLAAAFMGDVGVAETAIAQELGLVHDVLGVLVIGHVESRPPSAPRNVDATSFVRWDP